MAAKIRGGEIAVAAEAHSGGGIAAVGYEDGPRASAPTDLEISCWRIASAEDPPASLQAPRGMGTAPRGVVTF